MGAGNLLATVFLLGASGAVIAGSGSIAAPFRQGVQAYSSILTHLTSDEITVFLSDEPSLETNLKSWARRLGQRCEAMHVAFKRSEAAAKALVAAEDRRLQALGVESSRLDGTITQADKKVAALIAQTNGKRAEIATAERNLADTQRALESQERALKSAEDKYHKTKNKCISGRKKREAGFAPETGVVRVKRGFGGFLRKVGRTIAKPFEKVGRAVERGLCRGVGALTGRIRDMKRLRNNARAARDQARANLNAKRAQLNGLQSQLNQARSQLSQARSRRGQLEQQRSKLRGDIANAGKVAEGLKKATVYVASLIVPGKALTDSVNKVFVLDVDTLTKPLNQASDLLSKKLQAGTLPHIPRPTPAQLSKIATNLAAVEANLGKYPLVLTEEEALVEAETAVDEAEVLASLKGLKSGGDEASLRAAYEKLLLLED